MRFSNYQEKTHPQPFSPAAKIKCEMSDGVFGKDSPSFQAVQRGLSLLVYPVNENVLKSSCLYIQTHPMQLQTHLFSFYSWGSRHSWKSR